MNFLSPAFLFALPLVAVPVVIHLLSRRQQKRIAWGAMRFLLQAATRKRRLWRLTDLLLLLLRTAAFLFFVCALARPLLPSTWLGGSIPREVVLVLDVSLSTSRRLDGATVFERQREAAGRVLDDLKSADSLRVLLAGESPEWLTPEAVPARAGSLRAVRTRLEALKPTLGTADLLAAVREAADLEPPKDKAARVIVVVTDGCRFGWRTEEPAFREAIGERLDQAALPTTVRVQFATREPAGANLAVDRIETPRAYGAVGQTMAFTATVANHGPEPSAPTLLAWRVNDQAAGVATVPALEPGAATTLALNHPFPKPGVYEVAGELEARDDLPADDSGRCLVDVFERLPVLVVADRSAGDSLESDAGFVLAALGVRSGTTDGGGWRSVFAPTLTEPSALAAADLASYRCVILADLASLEPAAMAALEAYVDRGGGVWLALGPKTDVGAFNERWYRNGTGLAPMSLGEPQGDPDDRERFVAVRAASDSHPATALLSDFQRLDLDRARVYRRHRFDVATGRDVSVLIQAQGGEPVVVERKQGQGRVLVQAVPLGVSWSTLPLCQAYVAMLHEWLWYLSEPDLPRRNLALGEPFRHPAPRGSGAAEWVLPDDRPVEVIPSETRAGSVYRYTATRWPGPYELRLRPPGQAAERVPFQVRRDPRESDLAGLTEADQAAWAGVKALAWGAGLNDAIGTGEAPPPRHPLEGWLLGALPFLLLGELILAGWTNHRRNRRLAPVVMEGAGA
jgi:hypothetical protein